MPGRPVTRADLERLRAEREAADRAYNDALTALDQALPRLGSPSDAPPPDDHQAAVLNREWQILPDSLSATDPGAFGWLRRQVWRVVRPVLERQQTFNSHLVDHLNRTLDRERRAADAYNTLAHLARQDVAALTAFHSRLVLYLQQMTLYIDSRDREASGTVMWVSDAAVNGLADELLKHDEALRAREARMDAGTTAVRQAHEELRTIVASLQQATFSLKREVERRLTGPGPEAVAGGPLAAGSAAPALDSYKYVGFEDRFRGSAEEIRAKLADYVSLFAGATDVVDVGCGRGEFLDLLRDAGVGARGLDLNHEMVERCRARGHEAAETDLLSFLEAAPDGSIGGLFASQVVEHLEPAYLMRSLEVAYHKLRPGARIVLETINPRCWFAFFESYIRDLTHVRPVHPETLQYLLVASGFQRVQIRYAVPYPESERLDRVPVPPDDPRLREMADAINGHAERLNSLLFTDLDYAAIGERL